MNEYKIFRARYSGGDCRTRIVSAEALKESAAADFFEKASAIEELTECGVIRMAGDVHMLGDSYLED